MRFRERDRERERRRERRDRERDNCREAGVQGLLQAHGEFPAVGGAGQLRRHLHAVRQREWLGIFVSVVVCSFCFADAETRCTSQGYTGVPRLE